MELREPGIDRVARDQVGDVLAKRRGELEAVPARPRVHDDAVRDLADHRLPVRAHVVQARPAATRLGLREGRDAANERLPPPFAGEGRRQRQEVDVEGERGPPEQRLIAIAGSPPSPGSIPPGCAFNPRCRYALDTCRREVPPLVPVNGRAVACPVDPFTVA